MVGIGGMDLARRNRRDAFAPSPGHHPPNMRQHPPVIPDASAAIGKQEIPLRVDVDENLPPLRPDHLKYHPSTSFPGVGDSVLSEIRIAHKRVHMPTNRVPLSRTLVTLVLEIYLPLPTVLGFSYNATSETCYRRLDLRFMNTVEPWDV